ncbi:hypothetical protein M5K25_005341 [Dendrobium thyrsiflorum]|uniref:Uncharacterized protein n=1 Tax=Dendrobium thyrsiflorum TaxID=117978 RepID=A0ABD0VPS3_DENTH
MGRPVPEPPQLLQAIRPEPAQVRQPTSPSDHREQKQSTLPVPLQVGQRGEPLPDIGGRSRPSAAAFTSIAPATTPSPVATCVARTSGAISFFLS